MYYIVFTLVEQMYKYKEEFSVSATTFSNFETNLEAYVNKLKLILDKEANNKIYKDFVDPALTKEISKYNTMDKVVNRQSITSKQENNVLQHEINYKKLICEIMLMSVLILVIAYMIMLRYPEEKNNVIIGAIFITILMITYFIFMMYKRTRTVYKRQDWVKPKY